MAVQINQDRLWQSLMEMGKFGATPLGGVGRLALSDEDKQARDLFVEWCREADMTVRIDQMGNIIARREGTDPEAAPVMTGSHLDSQPLGGKFDGAYGVMAGLEVVRAMNDANIVTRAPIEVVNWTDEEGCRFVSGTMGSGVFVGVDDLEKSLVDPDPSGVTVGEELARIGYAGSEPVGGYDIAAYFEAHIEQGPILEKEDIPVGVVVGAQARRNYNVNVIGDEGHAGTMPMDQRQDALLGAARMIEVINKVAFMYEPWPVITVGRLFVKPGSRNTIPGGCEFTIDSRHPNGDTLHQIGVTMEMACQKIADDSRLELEFVNVSNSVAVEFDQRCVQAVRDAATKIGVKQRDIYSGAGHDACNLALTTPTGMVFVPCKDGISHNEKEDARPSDLAAGCHVLAEAMLEMAS